MFDPPKIDNDHPQSTAVHSALPARESEVRDGPSTVTHWSRRGVIAATSGVIVGGIAGCTGGGGNGGNGGDGDGGATATSTQESANTKTPGAADTPADNAGNNRPTFGNTLELRDEYAFEVTAHYQNLEWSGRQHGNDHYTDIRLAGTQRVETYFVDGTTYVVTQGLCITDPDPSNDPTTDLSLELTRPQTFEGAVTGHATVRSTGTTTIDGDTVHVFEISTEGTQVVYSVSAETGLLRRFEQQTAQGDIVIEFHSWGDTEPIEAPECPGSARDETSTPEETPTPDEASAGPAFGEAIEFQDEYAFEIRAHYQDLTVSGRQDGDDHYHDIQLQGTHVEEYVVDGTSYVVTQGLCVTDPSASSDPTSNLNLTVTDPATHETAVSGHATVTPTGSTTIDGETVFVYEISTNGTQSVYYVGAETSLLRRVEVTAPDGDIVVEFHSWGDVESIDPPSNCL